MNALIKILEEARAMQYRNGVTMREALALAMANQRRVTRMTEALHHGDSREPLQIQMPAAAYLDALLPRDREPTIDEIREAWKVCLEQSSLYGAAQRYEDRAEISAESLADAQGSHPPHLGRTKS